MPVEQFTLTFNRFISDKPETIAVRQKDDEVIILKDVKQVETACEIITGKDEKDIRAKVAAMNLRVKEEDAEGDGRKQ